MATKSFFAQEDTITLTTITERSIFPFLETEIIEDCIHVKFHPNDSNSFHFSVNNQFLKFHSKILDQFLISYQQCVDYVTNLISHMNLRPRIHHYLVDSISTSAIHWKNQHHHKRINGGYSIDFNLNEYANCSLGIQNRSVTVRDALNSPTGELSGAMSPTESECSEIVTKMKIMYEQDHVTTLTTSKDKINGCFLEKKTTNETIHINSVSIDSDEVSLSLIYEQDLEIHHDENLKGNKINVALERKPNPKSTLNQKIPYRFLQSEESCYDHIAIVVSELRFSNTTQEYIVSFISALIFHASRLRVQGKALEFTVNVNTEVNVDISLDPRRHGDDSSRILTAEMNCPICLNELESSEVSRMELPCSHIFHKDCIMTWLDAKSTCAICRKKVLGEIASIF